MSAKFSGVTFAVDFDGTCVEHEFPLIGRDVPHAVQSMNQILFNDGKIILHTMRSGHELYEAVLWFERNGIELYGVEKHPTQEEWTSSPKCHATFCIDDRNIGTPLIYPDVDPRVRKYVRPHVDWQKVMEDIEKRLSRF